MKPDTFTKVTLVVIACMLAVSAVGPFVRGDSVLAQSSGSRFGFLQSVGPPFEEAFFVDMRNGNVWFCKFDECRLRGHFPLEKISAGPAK